MDWVALFKLFQSWGPSAISSALVIVVIFLIKKIDKHEEDEKTRTLDLKTQLENKLEKVRGDINSTLGEHGRKISYIEMEYVKRDNFFRELSGWKEDIKLLSEKVDSVKSELMTRVIEVWKEWREKK